MAARLRDLVPVPLAAPETRALRRARIRVIAAAVLLAAACLFFAPFRDLSGRFAAPAVLALVLFLLVQVPLWLWVKNRADDVFLMRGCGRDD